MGITSKKVIIILAAFLGIAVVILGGARINAIKMEKQLQKNLEDVAKQNAEILSARVSAQYRLLESLTKELEEVTPDTIEATLDSFEVFMEDFHIKRFAFCFSDGTTYSTDGNVENLSYREFYLRGMQGKASITGTLDDALKVESASVNVLTVPVYDKTNEVCGVFGLAYDTEAFNQSLQIESFDGRGYSCIISESGEIMAQVGQERFRLGQNLFGDILAGGKENEKEAGRLRAAMGQKAGSGGSFCLPEKSYYYCVPADLMDGSVHWYILTIVPGEILTERMQPIQLNQYRTILLVGLLIALSAMLMLAFVRENNKELLRYAYVDPLTQASNARKFFLDMETGGSREGYLLLMGITNFNNVNIVAGEGTTDIMIGGVWEIIRDALRKEELAGHVRDDLFLLFLTDTDEQSVIDRMEEISGQIKKKARTLLVYGIRAEYGIYRMKKGESAESAYSKAQIAKDSAAKDAESHYAVYNEQNRVKAQQEKRLEESFPAALEHQEFEVWYQPKFSASDGTVVGSEALVRWRRKDGKLIPPGDFIPLFERNGMILKLDEYMFRTVCRQQKKWLDEGKKVCPVSINVSRATLYGTEIKHSYARILQECGIDPQYIQLEVTETVLQGLGDVDGILNKFRKMGIKVLMDDFGSGASSLATLSTQCFDTLKLDKSLIDHIGSQDGETLLYHIIRMGQQMGFHITAEGVESESQVEFLRHLNCDDIQGFFFSRPLPRAEYEAML